MAAAMPMAGPPRTRRARMASQTSSTVRQSRYSSRVGSRVWSSSRMKPSTSPTQVIVTGAVADGVRVAVADMGTPLPGEEIQDLLVQPAVGGDHVGAVDVG